MSESLGDKVSRLRAMTEHGQQSWDLSHNDTEAIALAVRVLSVIEFMDKPGCRMSMIHDVARGVKIVTAEVLSEDGTVIEKSKQCKGETWLECFSALGRLIHER